MISFVTAIIAFILSLLGNTAAETLASPVRIAGSFVRLTLSHNPGIAFGIRLPPVIQEITIGIALVLILLMARDAKDRLSQIGFGLIIGGAVANLFDRIGDGFVTDYIAVGTFPIFNIADSCITIGVCLLLLEAFLRHRAH